MNIVFALNFTALAKTTFLVKGRFGSGECNAFSLSGKIDYNYSDETNNNLIIKKISIRR